MPQEVLGNIRTVVSLGLEPSSCEKFSHLLAVPRRAGERDAQVNGLAVGFSSFIVFATYAFTFWYGGKLVNDDKITFRQLMRSLMAIIMSSQSVWASLAYVADSTARLKREIRSCLSVIDNYRLTHSKKTAFVLPQSRAKSSSRTFCSGTRHGRRWRC